MPEDEKITLRMGERALVATGFALQLPNGYEAQVRSRSGLAIRHGIVVLQGIGTVDADYRGEVMVALINLGQHPFDIVRGMRIAQLVVAPVTPVIWTEVADLSPSVRGGGGFGSTGSTGRGALPERDEL
jgi:dUTP pyrophosphatase